MSSKTGDKRIERGYDYWAAAYDDGDPSTWLDEPFLIEHLKPFPGCRILDLGCGTGRYLRRLASNLYRITAVDLSMGMLDRARTATGNSEISWVQASVTCLPFYPNLFDRVMSGLVLDHVESPVDFFGQIASIVKPKGRAVITAVHPEMQHLTGAAIKLANTMRSIRIPGHIHEVNDLVAAAQEVKLTVERLEEPLVTDMMVVRRSDWANKLGRPALLMMTLVK